MAKNTLIARRLVDSVEALRQVKAQLPIGKYLELLHIAAVTGELRKLDPWTLEPQVGLDGTTIITTPISVEDRIKILGGLIDKVIPDAKTVDAPTGTSDPTLLLKQDMTKMTREQLLGIVSAYATASEAEVEE